MTRLLPLFLAILTSIMAILAGCNALPKQNSETSDSSSSQSETESSLPPLSPNSLPNVVSSEGSVHPIKLAELISTEGDWNTWKLALPLSKQNVKEYFIVQVCLPSHWQPIDTGGFEINNNFLEYNWEFVENKDQESEKWTFRPFTVQDWQGNERWEAVADKLEFMKAYLSSGKGFGIDNTISFEIVEVKGVRWLWRCAFAPTGYTDDINFFQALVVYENRYVMLFSMNIDDKTLEDQEVRDLVMAILESWELVEILSF